MALQKKFQPVEELLVFPSLEPTIEVIPIEVNPIEKPIVNNVQNLIKPRRTHR